MKLPYLDKFLDNKDLKFKYQEVKIYKKLLINIDYFNNKEVKIVYVFSYIEYKAKKYLFTYYNYYITIPF